VRALSQINEAKKAEKERQERLESLQKQCDLSLLPFRHINNHGW